MGDKEEDELKMAMRMSMQIEPPEPKRSKPMDNAATGSGGLVDNRRLQRELMAAAAEKRLMAAKKAAPVVSATASSSRVDISVGVARKENLADELSLAKADLLFSMIFGDQVSKDVLAQWSNQGIRYLLYVAI